MPKKRKSRLEVTSRWNPAPSDEAVKDFIRAFAKLAARRDHANLPPRKGPRKRVLKPKQDD